MTNLNTPYYCIDDMYAVVIMSIFIIGTLIYKVYKLKQENKKLQSLCTSMKKYCTLSSPDKVFNYFGVDIIKIMLSKKLAENKAIDGLIQAIFELRIKLADRLGYVIPDVRILENKDLKENNYEIFVRDKLCDNYTVVNHDNPIKEIVDNLEMISLEKIDKIFLRENAEKLMENVTDKDLRQRLKNQLSIDGLRQIFITLIISSYSIKDINYIAECLDRYIYQTKSVDELVMLLKNDMQ